jgi:hypothetical protein
MVPDAVAVDGRITRKKVAELCQITEPPAYCFPRCARMAIWSPWAKAVARFMFVNARNNRRTARPIARLAFFGLFVRF